MLQSVRERFILILIGFLPFHAFLVTFFTKLVKGPGHPPWTMLAVWKEVLLAAILCIAIYEVYQLIKDKDDKREALKFDQIDFLVIAFFIVAFLVALFAFRGTKATVFGIKYDLVPLAAFLLLRRVEWSEEFAGKALRVVLVVGVAVCVLGLVSFAFPMKYLTALGYSGMHSLYLPGDSIAAFQQIGESSIRRLQSTMSGPNQLGLWLLLPFAISLLGFLRCVHSDDNWFFRLLRFAQNKRAALCMYGLSCALIGVSIFFTFSRSAWISTAVIIVAAILMRFSTETAQRYLVRLIAPFLFGFALLAIIAPHVIFRENSTADHLLKPLLGIHEMASAPFGKGLGAAGPASNRTSDACVYLDVGSDVSWAKSRPDLCVIVGGVQVQPDGRLCNCPFVTENWYIQVGVELGFLGFFLFLCITFFILQKLWRAEDDAHFAVMYAFLGVSIAGLFLHSWEDAAVAYTIWILLAQQMSIRLKESLLHPDIEVL